MDVNAFDYHLPEELIADTFLPRGSSRMMILDRDSEKITHSKFRDFVDSIDENCTVVFNASKVIPARLFGTKSSGGKVEFLLVKEFPDGSWEAMGRSSKPLKSGESVSIDGGMEATVVSRSEGLYNICFSAEGNDLYSFLETHGDVPLPPYILKKRGEKRCREEDRRDYQTVYAQNTGSVAAPTAGLHFSDETMDKLREKLSGRVEFVSLHVGLGTFLPVKSEKLEEHKMHSERFSIPEDVAERLNRDKREGRKIVAVGTTTVRALETAAREDGTLAAGEADSSIFIYPGYNYRFVDSILTNFHLPKSTLIMMISAFAGYDFVMSAYKEAVKEKYRFYSYGDCMLIR